MYNLLSKRFKKEMAEIYSVLSKTRKAAIMRKKGARRRGANVAVSVTNPQ